MKRVLIFLTLASSLFANENLKQQIDSIVEIISQPRVAVAKSEVNKLKDPFIKQKVQTDNEETFVVAMTQPTTPSYKRAKFTLHAIINDSAKINNRWITRGDTINGFVLEDIGTNFVKLSYQNFDTKVLYLNKANNNFISRSNGN